MTSDHKGPAITFEGILEDVKIKAGKIEYGRRKAGAVTLVISVPMPVAEEPPQIPWDHEARNRSGSIGWKRRPKDEEKAKEYDDARAAWDEKMAAYEEVMKAHRERVIAWARMVGLGAVLSGMPATIELTPAQESLFAVPEQLLMLGEGGSGAE